MRPEPNGRTHAPNLHELTIELDGTRALLLAKIEAIRELFDERDRLYKERDDARRTAVDAALTAVKDQTKANFDASEKAIVKAEDAQRDYNQRSNEFRGQLDDQAKTLMARLEALGMFKAVEDKLLLQTTGFDKAIDEIKKEITGLRESRSELGGRSSGRVDTWQYGVAVIGVIGLLLGTAIGLITFFRAPALQPQPIYVPAPAGTTLPASPPGAVPR